MAVCWKMYSILKIKDCLTLVNTMFFKTYFRKTTRLYQKSKGYPTWLKTFTHQQSDQRVYIYIYTFNIYIYIDFTCICFKNSILLNMFLLTGDCQIIILSMLIAKLKIFPDLIILLYAELILKAACAHTF